MWLTLYACGWVLTAYAALAFADALRDRSMSRPVTPLLVAVLAGALWPLLVIGLLEVLCVGLARRLRHADRAPR